MSKIKKISFVALILFVAGVVGGLLTYHNDVKKISFEKTITQNFTNLDVNAGNENIVLIPTESTVAKVKLTGESSPDFKQDYTVNVRDNTLYIKLNEHQDKFYNFNFSIFKPLTLNIYVPEKQFASFVIHNDNGEITACNLKVNNMMLTTNNGAITIKNTTVDDVNVHSDNGAVTLQGNITGKIAGTTNNGRISLSVPDINYPIQLVSDNGSITIQTSREPDNVTYDVYSDNGSVTIFNKYKSSTVVGHGDNLIKLMTDNGKISITK